MIEAMEHFSEYLCYKEFVLFTDHQPLTWLKRQKGLHGKLWRWAFRIKQFNFKIKYRKGEENANADALSRLPQENEDPENTDETSFKQHPMYLLRQRTGREF